MSSLTVYNSLPGEFGSVHSGLKSHFKVLECSSVGTARKNKEMITQCGFTFTKPIQIITILYCLNNLSG